MKPCYCVLVVVLLLSWDICSLFLVTWNCSSPGPKRDYWFCDCSLIGLPLSSLQLESFSFDWRQKRPGCLWLVRATHTHVLTHKWSESKAVSPGCCSGAALCWPLAVLSPTDLCRSRLFSHVDDPFLDDPLPREYVLYLRPSGPLLQQLSHFWQQSRVSCGKNKAHNIFPHITLCQFFMVSVHVQIRALLFITLINIKSLHMNCCCIYWFSSDADALCCAVSSVLMGRWRLCPKRSRPPRPSGKVAYPCLCPWSSIFPHHSSASSWRSRWRRCWSISLPILLLKQQLKQVGLCKLPASYTNSRWYGTFA